MRNLLDLIEPDLRPCRVDRLHDTAAHVTAADGTVFGLTVHVDRRKLMTLQEATAHVDGPPAAAEVTTTMEFHHTGQFRRTGLRAKLRGPASTGATVLRDRLLADPALRAACLPLDFTQFRVVVVDGRWRAELRLMGGSHVRTRLPPGGSYVRLGGDQRDTLLATVRALARVLPAGGSEPAASTSMDSPAHLSARPISPGG